MTKSALILRLIIYFLVEQIINADQFKMKSLLKVNNFQEARSKKYQFLFPIQLLVNDCKIARFFYCNEIFVTLSVFFFSTGTEFVNTITLHIVKIKMLELK